jgi:hypothetical protein
LDCSAGLERFQAGDFIVQSEVKQGFVRAWRRCSRRRLVHRIDKTSEINDSNWSERATAALMECCAMKLTSQGVFRP